MTRFLWALLLGHQLGDVGGLLAHSGKASDLQKQVYCYANTPTSHNIMTSDSWSETDEGHSSILKMKTIKKTKKMTPHNPHLTHGVLQTDHRGDALQEVLQVGVAQLLQRDDLSAQRAVLRLESAYGHTIPAGLQHRPQHFLDRFAVRHCVGLHTEKERWRESSL